MERIAGPYEGIYIAAYTTRLDGLFYGYAKLCLEGPEDVWAAKAILKIGTLNGSADEAAALQAVEEKAVRVISELQYSGDGFWSRLSLL